MDSLDKALLGKDALPVVREVFKVSSERSTNWCFVPAPHPAWAALVHPDLPAALIRTGGTLPIVPALTGKGIPTAITGFGLPESRIHAPNERLVADYVPLGIATSRELFLAFAEL